MRILCYIFRTYSVEELCLLFHTSWQGFLVLHPCFAVSTLTELEVTYEGLNNTTAGLALFYIGVIEKYTVTYSEVGVKIIKMQLIHAIVRISSYKSFFPIGGACIHLFRV